uniref:Uncharacterized HTH-type transcriptional regulator yneJ n=1 Tax=Yersinia enterocolitica W22703 TaxID=913028 RepID=F4MY58_YEREN|nr:uncharacterized HTH-type transcriptional regulator yneJ [Yersinia enterocolitica W22703]
MHRVPSNLTTRLRQLEIELGADLFIREKQRLRLSPMGHNFLCYANRILALSEKAMSITHAGEPAGNFPLGSMESTAATRLPNLLAAYHQRYPKVSLSLTTGTSGEIIEQVRAGTLATALVDGPVQHDELHGCRSFEERLVIISCLDHLAINQARDAVDETLFAFRPSCSYRLRLESWFRQTRLCTWAYHGNPVLPRHASLCGKWRGLALIPHSVLALLPGHERVKVHHLPPDIAETATWLIWRKDAFSPNVRALKELIIEQIETQ